MNTQTNIPIDFESDFRVSPGLLVAVLVVLGTVMVYLTTMPVELLDRAANLAMGCGLIIMALALIWFERRHVALGRMIALLALVGSVALLGQWVGAQTALMLGPALIVLAVALVGPWRALVPNIVQTFVVLWVIPRYDPALVASTLTVSVIALWLCYAVIHRNAEHLTDLIDDVLDPLDQPGLVVPATH
jgi:hypothetical protein